MKKTIPFLLLLVFISCKKEKKNTFTLTAKINHLNKDANIILLNIDEFKVIDSTRAKNKTVLFTDTISYPFNARMVINDSRPIFLDFWIEPGTLEIDTSMKEIINNEGQYFTNIEGGSISPIIKKFNKKTTPFQEKKKQAYSKLKNNIITQNCFDKVIDTLVNESYNFFIKHPNNYFTLSEIINYKLLISKEKLKVYYNLLSTEFKNSSNGKLLKNYINAPSLKIGDNFIDIVGENLNGQTIKLSDYKEKIILLDFWASWCKPCLEKIKSTFPIIKNKYNDIEIISFSFDTDKKSWETISKNLKIDWVNFSNLKSMNNSLVADNYNIEELPTSIIINQKGEILRRIEYNDDLLKELEILFKNKTK